MQLTEQQIQTLKSKVMSGIPSRRCMPFLKALSELCNHLRDAYKENDALRDQLRWRTPDPETGEWREEDLPELGIEVDVTMVGISAPVVAQWLGDDRDWADSASCIRIPTRYILAWRPRPAPYTADKEKAP